MPRRLRRLIPMLFALLLPLPTGHRPTHAASHADYPRIEVTVHGDTVRWFGPSGVVVRAELRGPRGLKATAAARNTSYNVTLRFAPVESGQDPRIRSGDEVVVTPERGDVVRAVVPELAADADATADRIVGRAPPATQVEVLRDFDKPLGTVASDAAGDVVMDLHGRHDVARGFTGQLRFVTADDIAFTTWFDVADVALWAETERLEVRASLGTTVTVAVRTPAGARTDHVVSFSRPAYFSAPFLCPDCPRLEPGTSVTVTKQGALPALDSIWTGSLPVLGVRLDRGANAVHLMGPPGGDVTVAVGDVMALRRGQPAVEEALALDATGRTVLDLAGRAEIVPGWMARLTTQAGPGVTLFAEDLLRVVRASVWGPHIEGIAAPSVAVSVTLTAPNGAVKAEAVANSGLAGNYSLWFGSASAVPRMDGPLILPGDILQIEEHDSGDPVSVEVPHLTVRADAASDVVSGEGPPGYEIHVSTDRTISRQASWQGGRYSADFAGIKNLAPNMAGLVLLRQRSGRFEFHTCWSITELDLLLGVSIAGGQADLRGSGCAGRGVRVRWLTPDGRQVADYREMLRPEGIAGLWSAQRWLAAMQDSGGRGLEMAPGDRFEVDIGDDHLAVTVPELTVESDVAADTVGGRTTPNTPVTLSARHRGTAGETFGNTAVSDADGRWRFSYRGTFEIQHGDSIVAGIRTPEGYWVRRIVEAPGLLLDLNDATLTGVSLPDGDLVAELVAAGTTRAKATARTPSNGVFHIVFRAPNGQLLRPRAGESVRVTVHNGGRRDVMAMVVPDLTIVTDRAVGAVRGRATPGGALIVQARGLLFSAQGTDGVGTIGSAFPVIAADGTWAVPVDRFGSPGGMASPITLFPGLSLAIQYRLPEGHLVALRSFEPVANVEHGGPHVCGAGPAGAPVEATVADGVAVRGRATGEVGDDLRYMLVLRDDAGQPVISRPGDTVRTVVAGVPLGVTLPPLSLEVLWRVIRPGWAWPVSLVSGSGPPLRQAYVRTPAEDCFTGAAWFGIQEYLSDTDAAGAYRAYIDHQTGGGGVELAFLTADRNRFYRHILRGQMRIHVGTDRVTGRAMPLQPVTITLTSAAGAARGQAQGRVDAEGRYDVRLIDAAGRPAASRAGDVARLSAGADASEAPIQPLSFDFDTDDGLAGATRPGATVQLRLRLIDASTRRFERVADAAGRFHFASRDIPAREDWSLIDVRGIELVLPVDGGHELVAAAEIGAALPRTVFLPFAVGARTRR